MSNYFYLFFLKFLIIPRSVEISRDVNSSLVKMLRIFEPIFFSFQYRKKPFSSRCSCKINRKLESSPLVAWRSLFLTLEIKILFGKFLLHISYATIETAWERFNEENFGFELIFKE